MQLYLNKLLTSLIIFMFIDEAIAQKPSLQATKISVAPKIDGKLDDAVWQNVPIATDFITYTPEYGKVPTKNTLVKVLYDNAAIYIGAYMLDDHPEGINKQLSERDGASNADKFTVGFDTYDDDLNGYRFTVSAAGVQTDQRIALNSNSDLSWDAVWESNISINADGWSCEIKIPYSAIRFPAKEIQNWGLQFNRLINSTSEFCIWSPVDPKVFGIINQWGSLIGLENITPPLRLSFSPYITTGYQWSAINDEPPIHIGSKTLNGGMDVKYGLNESFTLDATLIPDFGEVQSDNVILNLSPFETQFNDRRPFFTEGTELFNQEFGFQSDKLFYSRRVGGLPIGYFDAYANLHEHEEVLSNPQETNLYNATKLSGRTNTNLGIGVFNAVSTPEYAQIKNTETGEIRKELTSPLSNYNVMVIDQSLKNNSKISFTNTNVIRDGSYTDANVSSLRVDITDNKHKFNTYGFANVSQQYNNALDKNPTAGYYYFAGLSDIEGKFGWDIFHNIISKNYNQNDLGILYYNNEMENFIGARYNNQEPKKGIFYSYYASISSTNKFRVEPFDYEQVDINVNLNGQFKNLWYAGINVYAIPAYYYDFYEPRFEGYKYRHAPFVFGSAWLNTDARKKLTLNASIGVGESPVPQDPYAEIALSPVWIVNDKLNFTLSAVASKDHSNFGFVDYGYDDASNLIIYFGRRNITTVSNELSAKFSFGPKMNITARARHYWSKVVYLQFYTLQNTGDLDANTTFTGNYDLDFNAFNIDFVYAWEFAPGSYLNIIWKNNILEQDQYTDYNYFDNVKSTFRTPQSNGISLKLIYYLDYLTLRKNHTS